MKTEIKPNYAIILASGSGSRTGLSLPKQFFEISGKTILEYTLDKFEKHSSIDYIILVSNPDFIDKTKSIVNKKNYKKIKKIIPGGITRQESSYNGLSQIQEKNAKVLIHDAVRPFVEEEMITRCINLLDKYKAVNIAIDSSDTLIETDENNFIKRVPDRKTVKRVQTPQGFDLQTIKKAHELAKKNNDYTSTDDCSIVYKYNVAKIFVTQGSEANIKITYPEDIEMLKHKIII